MSINEELLKRAEKKAEAMSRQAKELAHDFNNVLCGIIGYTDMALERAEKDPDLEDNLQKVLEAAEKAKELLQRLRTLSRPENPQLSSASALPPLEGEPAAAAACRGGTERILLVDNGHRAGEALNKDMMIRLGYTATALHDSLAALTFIKEKGDDIDLLVADQTMPGMTGVELAKEVLKIRTGLPIILCTGFSSGVNPKRTADIGISRLLVKPFSDHDICSAIREVLDSKREGVTYVEHIGHRGR